MSTTRRMNLVQRIKEWAHRIARDSVTLWFACRDARTRLPVRMLCALIVAYALSPIDLIPDFIPILGYVDDALLLPAMIWLALRLLPPPVVDDSRSLAVDWLATHAGKPTSKVGAALVVLLWLAIAYGAWVWWRS